ncbi:membrane-associated protein, putative [Bodo saltans]|uniref:Membrane-associated protein, putative n=1 Tax=Bodo saltans TaxID=75058 RepID=A0A0S4JBF0_BODSA|nr:membrane-associated protein, putative [Bodo saltans]|eukprot:CUG88856.1 membrane-associated protein, putative [Bodo saltans]
MKLSKRIRVVLTAIACCCVAVMYVSQSLSSAASPPSSEVAGTHAIVRQHRLPDINVTAPLDPQLERAAPQREGDGAPSGFSAFMRGRTPFPGVERRETQRIQGNKAWFRSQVQGSWRLPLNQTRFCRAYDGLSALERSRLLRLPLDGANLEVRSNLLCDEHSPASITQCFHEECHEGAGCLIAVPSPHCRYPSVVVPFRQPSRTMRHQMRRAAVMHLPATLTPYEEAVMGNYSSYPLARLQQCADFAMQSYAHHAFQLLDARTCVVYRYFAYAFRAHSPVQRLPIFTFLHRSEMQPSLFRDNLRFVVLSGVDGKTVRVASTNNNRPQPFVVKISLRGGGFGEIVPLGIRVHIVATTYISDCYGASVAALAAIENRTVLLAQQAQDWASPQENTPAALSPETAELSFRMGGEIGLTLSSWAGCKLKVRVVGHPTEISSGTALPQLRKEIEALIVYDSADVRLAHDMSSINNITTSCAPFLREDECCLNGVRANHVAVVSLTPLVLSRAAFSSRWEGKAVFLRLATEHHPCVSVVDGHISSFDYRGTAEFPWLVVRNRCSADVVASIIAAANANITTTSAAASSVQLELRLVEKNVLLPGATLSLSLQIFGSCSSRRGNSNAVRKRTTPPPSALSPPRYNGQDVVVLVSLAVHEKADIVAQQLRNIAAFVPSSVVVLHISASWLDVNLAYFYSLNGTAHPHVIVNTKRSLFGFTKLALVQMSNCLFVAEKMPWVKWTHVVLFASNELFVKSGLEHHLQHFDMSFPGRPSPRQAISVLHSFSTGRPEIEFVDPEDRNRAFTYKGRHRDIGGTSLHGEFSFNRMLQLLGLHAYSTHQLYTEGSFFNRSIALRLAFILDVLFDESEGDCVNSHISVSEAFLLQNHAKRVWSSNKTHNCSFFVRPKRRLTAASPATVERV